MDIKNTNKKLYSNTKNTKNKIKRSLLKLLSTNDLSKISITELVKLSGIYRATFYIHYSSTNDVILDIEKDTRDKYFDIYNQTQNIDIYENFSALLKIAGKFIKEDKDYLKVIINTNCFNRVTLKLKDLLELIILDNFKKFNHFKDGEDFRFALSFITGGIVFSYRDWICNSTIEDINQVNKHILKNINKTPL